MLAAAMQYDEKRARFDALPSPEVNSAEVRGIERGNGFAQRVFKWLEPKNVFGVYKNDNTGWNDIAVNKRTVKSVINHGGANGKIALLEFLPQMINNGIYLETNPENKRGLVSHIFANKATIDGEPYAVTYVVREDRSNKRYYDHSLIKIKALDQINDQVPAYTNEDSQGTQLHTRPEEIPLVKTSLNNILKKHFAVNTQSEKN
jgi:hypothetical protein